MKKKVMAFLLCGCMFLSLAACSYGTAPDSSFPPQSDSSSDAPPPDGPEGKPERAGRDLTSYILPSNEVEEESLPSAAGKATQEAGVYKLKGEAFELSFAPSSNDGYALSVCEASGAVCSGEAAPAKLYIRGTGLLSSGYESVSIADYGLKASAVLKTVNGSEFCVEDRYYLPAGEENDAFNVRRCVRVLKASASDKGFESIYRMSLPAGGVGEYSWFVPNNVFDSFPGSATEYASSKIFRETLLGLPFAMFRNKTSGLTFSLGRYQPEVTLTENSYASVSLLNEEGETPNIEIAYPSRDTARRYFDVQEDNQIVYDLTLRAAKTSSYAAATSSAYNAHFDLQNQRIVDTDIDAVYEAVCADFKTFLLSTKANGVTSYGLPWRVTIETGKIGPKSYQAGFVGQQIPAAYHMLYYGVLKDDAQSFKNGMNVLDFWVNAGMMTEAGVPKIWYGGDTNYFWKYPTFLRMAVDAMEGLLDAYRLVSAHGVVRRSWYDAILSFANFLVEKQNTDGSWWRCYNWDGGMFKDGDNGIGEPGGNICQSSSKANTTMPVRFLGKIYELTGEAKYKTAAVKGGEYVYKELYPLGYYNGGTCDNPNAQDKEAGVFAMYCYDTMYMLTKEEKWIDCLKQATAFTMSSVVAYSFDISQRSSSLKAALALKHGYTDGLSFITCGGTGVDNYIAYIYYELFRIYIITGEREYLRQAEFIQQNTKSTMDWDGALGYPYKSLVAEATTIYTFGFNSAVDDEGVMGVWLPWASVANAEPIAKMYDNFGEADVAEFWETSIESLRSQLKKIGVGGKAHRKYVTTAAREYLS